MTEAYTERLDRALAFTAKAFRCETRKISGTPYLMHLLEVMVLVADGGGDEDQMIAALLHDYLEDIEGATTEEIAEEFGVEVCRMVETLSDAHGSPKPPWEERKQGMIDRIATADDRVKLVCVADKLHNVRSILWDARSRGPSVLDSFSVPKDRTVWYYREIAEALAVDFEHPLLDDLNVVVKELTVLAEQA